MTDASKLDNDDSGEFLIYAAPDGQTRIEVRMQAETVWLTQKQMAELFQTSKQNVSLHLQNVFDEGELAADSTVKKYLTVQTEGKRDVSRQIDHYNLQAIIAVGYRVRSPRGTQFRIWATERLREYLVKGFTMDDDRLKRGGVRMKAMHRSTIQNTEAQRTQSFPLRISFVIFVPPCFKSSRAEIAEHCYVLTPGRFVGAEEVEDDGVLLVSKPERGLTRELATQFHKSEKLQSAIRDNMQKQFSISRLPYENLRVAV